MRIPTQIQMILVGVLILYYIILYYIILYYITSHISMKAFILEVETELENFKDEWDLGGSFSPVFSNYASVSPCLSMRVPRECHLG